MAGEREETSMNRNPSFARLRVVIASSLIVGAAGIASVSPARAVTLYSANLAGDQVVPGPGDPDAVGRVWDLGLGIDPDVPNGGRICVGWEITDMGPATSAEIGIGQPGEAGTTVVSVIPPDEEGAGYDCAVDLDPAVVQAILDDPTAYFVQVRNDEFPDGAMRGQIQFTQIMSVNIRKFVCPGSIRTPADLLAAPAGTCTVAARTGDIGDPPPGYTWSPKPTEFNMQVRLDTDAGSLTLDDADLDGGGTCGARTCTPGRSYTWENLTPGPMTMTELTFPKGYRFGWATIQARADGDPAPTGTVDVATQSISFDLTNFGATDGVSIAIYDFRGH
jgi:hypothetical protein